jgi:spore maturation protein CgeB
MVLNLNEKDILASLPVNKSPKVLLVGDFAWPQYQEACALSLEQHGCEVIRFGWMNEFRHWVPGFTEFVYAYHSIFHKIQFRMRTGPIVWRIHKRLIKIAAETDPNIVWFYNVTIIPAKVVKEMRRVLPDAVFCQYSNDNPFINTKLHGFWSHYLESINYFDLHFAYRHSNFADYQRLGALHVKLLRSYFIPEHEYPMEADLIPAKFVCDVVFAGHYEDDGRLEILEAICNAGYTLNLFGDGWNTAINKLSPHSPLREKYPVTATSQDEYRYAICGAKVALCFLSTHNEDTYTRRCFQIPAMKSVMLSQHTDDLASLFQPDVEAVFFKNKSEILEKLKVLLCDDQKLQEIAEAGYNKVYLAGHDVKARMREFLNHVEYYSTTRRKVMSKNPIDSSI